MVSSSGSSKLPGDLQTNSPGVVETVVGSLVSLLPDPSSVLVPGEVSLVVLLLSVLGSTDVLGVTVVVVSLSVELLISVVDEDSVSVGTVLLISVVVEPCPSSVVVLSSVVVVISVPDVVSVSVDDVSTVVGSVSLVVVSVAEVVLPSAVDGELASVDEEEGPVSSVVVESVSPPSEVVEVASVVD